MHSAGAIKTIVKGALLQGDPLTKTTGISIDTRTLKRRQVYVAVVGRRFDGHDFIRQAARKGVAAVIVSKKVACPKHLAVIRVADTTDALCRLAAYHRLQFNVPVIAVTGSTGKTTTKDLIAAVLAARYKVLKNVKTENNQYGVALTLLRLNRSYGAVVLECGTNTPGEIRALARMVRPTAAVYTNIGASHLKGLKNIGGILREKVQLLTHMSTRGPVFINADDPRLKKLKQLKPGLTFTTYGFARGAAFRAEAVELRKNWQLAFKVKKRAYVIHTPARHNIYNALAAISCGLALKIRYNEIKRALSRFRFQASRLEMVKLGPSWLIDDSYNANPVSLTGAVETLNALDVKGKKILVCADMLELGPRSKELHRAAGTMIALSAADLVYTLGPQARYITQNIKAIGNGKEAEHFRTLQELHGRLKKRVSPGDLVLVKGSRGMGMERTVAFLKEHLKR